MAGRLVALEWDSAEARVAIGRVRGKDLLLEHAFAVDLTPSDGAAGLEDAEIGARIAEALAPYRVGRQDAMVAVGRTNIELRRLQLPPAPDEELPDMVRFQAMRQFSTIGEQWPIDFVPLSRSASSIDVLAAAISPAIVESIQSVCGQAELTAEHLVLRPFAAAALLRHSSAADNRCRLLVDLLATEADLSVIVDGVVAFVRTVRLPPADGPTPALVQTLVGEIRRTIPAAQSQLGGSRIEVITFCGDGTTHKELLEQLAPQLPLPLDWIDPFASVQLAASARDELPGARARYAPLLGMMLTAASGTPHDVDFLHPRQRPQVRNQRERRLAIAAAVVAILCLMAGGLKWYLSQREAAVLRVEREVAAAKPTREAAEKQIADLAEVQQFLEGSVSWLEELAHLSREMPRAEEAIVTQLSASVRAGEGRMTIDGYARDSELIGELEHNLRTDRHRVEGSNRTQDPSRADYPWNFKETISINPRVVLVRDENKESENAVPDEKERSPSEREAPDEVDGPTASAQPTAGELAENDPSEEDRS